MYKLFFLLFSGTILCKTPNAQAIGLRVYHENDFLRLTGKNRDDNYTGGSKAEIISGVLNASRFIHKKIINPLQWNPLVQSFSFSFPSFTPNDIANSNVVLNDRPYASYSSFNFGFSFTHPNKMKQEKITYELSLGAMGWKLAGNLQEYAHSHHLFGSTRPVPNGWQYQIADGGSFAANLKIAFLKILSKGPKRNFFQFGWLHEANAGQYLVNYTQGLRLYLLNVDNNILLEGIPEIPVFETSANPKSPEALKDRQQPKKLLGISVYVTPRLKAVLHNATLTGNWIAKESVHVFPQQEVKNLLWEFDACLFLHYGVFQLGYTQYGRSKEFKSQTINVHSWGGLFLGLIF